MKLLMMMLLLLQMMLLIVMMQLMMMEIHTLNRHELFSYQHKSMLINKVFPIRSHLAFGLAAAASAGNATSAYFSRFLSVTSNRGLKTNRSYSSASAPAATAAVRTRFAPSPTGSLHLGGLRTALFCHVFARKHKGSFILRIEDTDQSRLVPDAADEIAAALLWAGIGPDEGPPPSSSGGAFGPYTQSQRLPIYRRAAADLVARGHAYPCFCDSHRLESAKAAALSKGLSYKYDRRCSYISPEQAAARVAAGEPHVVRLRAPVTGVTVVPDAVRGDVVFENSTLDDAVLLKSDGWPTYHLACVVDDCLMRISHVIRGEEWLSSAPKHVIIYKAMNQPLPVFVHLPLLLNPDGSKLSKRQGHAGVSHYIRSGYEPEAVLNFIMLLGWSAPGGQEVLSMSDIIKSFDLAAIHKSGAIVSEDRLVWLNKQHLRTGLSPIASGGHAALHAKARRLLTDAYGSHLTLGDTDSAISLVRSRLNVVADVVSEARFLFEEPVLPLPLSSADADILRQFGSALQAAAEANPSHAVQHAQQGVNVCQDSAQATAAAISALRATTKLKPPQLFPCIRMALTGKSEGLPIADIVSGLGVQRALRRIRAGTSVK